MLLFSHSVVFDSVTPWTTAHEASLSFTMSQSLLKLVSIESMMSSNHLILCCPLLACLKSFPASGSFPMGWLFTSGGQSIGVSASVSVLPMNIQYWFPLGLTGLTPCCPRDSQESSQAPPSKASALQCSAFLTVQFNSPVVTSVNDYQKNHSFDYMDLYQQINLSAF